MIKLIVDGTLPEKLRTLAEPAELCDQTGRVLGRFFPQQDLSEYELWEPTFSEEELRRSEQSDKWYTTEQVLAHLKSLENQ